MFQGSDIGKHTGGDSSDGAISRKRGIYHCIGTDGHVIADCDGAIKFSARTDIDVVAQCGGAIVITDRGGGVDAAVGADTGGGVHHHRSTMHEAESGTKDILGDGHSQLKRQPVVQHLQKGTRNPAPVLAVAQVLELAEPQLETQLVDTKPVVETDLTEPIGGKVSFDILSVFLSCGNHVLMNDILWQILPIILSLLLIFLLFLHLDLQLMKEH